MKRNIYSSISVGLLAFFLSLAPPVGAQAPSIATNNLPPTVTIVSPTNNASFTAPANIVIIAQASDPDETVSHVSFYAGTNLLGIRTNYPVANILGPFVLNWSNVHAGEYLLTARASTPTQTGTSAPVRVRVEGDFQPTVVTVYHSDREGSEIRTPDGTVNLASFSIRREGPTNLPLTVNYSLGGTAGNGLDYYYLSNSVVILAGSSTRIVQVLPIDDTFVEQTESVSLTVIPPLCAAVSPPPSGCYNVGFSNSATVFIYDNDVPGTNISPTVNLHVEDSVASEPGVLTVVDPATVRISRTGPTNIPLQVFLEIGGSAANGSDYQYLSNQVVIPAGSVSTLVRVWAIQDNLAEPTETVAFRLVPPVCATIAPPPPGCYQVGPSNFAVVEIRDHQIYFSNRVSLVSTGSNWRYYFRSNPPPESWNTSSYNAAEWQSGPAQLGFGDGDEQTVILNNSVDRPLTAYFRKTFQVENALQLDRILIGLLRDDGGVVYLNGREIFRSNMPDGPITPNTTAVANVNPGPDETSHFFEAEVPAEFLRTGENLIAVEIHQANLMSADLSFDLFLSANQRAVPSNQPPFVRLTRPVDGTTVHFPTNVLLVAEANDPDGLIRLVEFFKGTNLLGQASRIEGTYRLMWSNPPVGTHVLFARATDDRGSSVVSTGVHLIVEGPAPLPTVNILTSDPEAVEGTSNNAAFRITRTPSASGSLLVHYRLGGSASNGFDYARLNGYAEIPAGSNSVEVIIRPLDDKTVEGREEVSATLIVPLSIPTGLIPSPPPPYRIGESSNAVAFIVDNDVVISNRSPVVRITEPTYNARFTAGSNISIVASVTDPDGYPTRVQFFANEHQIDEQSLAFIRPPEPGGTYSFHTLWSNVPAGIHVLTVRAQDNSGKWGTSGPVEIRVVSPHTNSFAERNLPNFYLPQRSLIVQIQTRPPHTNLVYTVEDSPPPGWTVGAISHEGVFDSANRKVKFGPFYDGQPRLLTYAVTSPANEHGPMEFSGWASINGINSVITGDRVIRDVPLHPADINPADLRITSQELTAFGFAWQQGSRTTHWSNGIAIQDLTRAAMIWRRGEVYFIDPELLPPFCWVPAGLISTSPVPRIASSSLSQAIVEAIMSTNGTPGIPLDVQIRVRPGSENSGYAVEDRPAYGWVPSQISHNGVFDAESGKIKWGPFVDAESRTLSYSVAPPTHFSGSAGFGGTASFDGQNLPVTGSRHAWFGEARPAGDWGLHPETGGALRVNLRGEGGLRYSVEVSTNLLNWTRLGSVICSNGTVQITDPAGNRDSQRFYRAVPEP